MRRLLLTTSLMAVALLTVPSAASAEVCAFQGPGAAWHNPANWDCMMIPGAADTAVVSDGDSVTVDQDGSVASLTLSGGQVAFTGNPTLSISGAASVSSGTLTGDGNLSVAGGGAFAKTSAGQLTVQNGADLVLNADGVVSGGSICLQDAGGGDPSLVINERLEITDGADPTVFNCDAGLDGPAILISSAGELLKDFVGATSIATPVDDDGQFNVLAGSMLLQGGTGGATWSGGYTTADGATSTFSSPHTLTSTAVITGAGHTIVSSSVTVPSGGTFTPTTLTHNGGTLSLAGGSPTLAPVTYNLSGGVLSGNRPLQPSAAMNVTGGTLTGNFTTTINGSATFSKTSGGQLTVQNGADLVLNADASVSGGSVCLQDAGGGDPSLVINRQLQITAAADQTVFSCNGALNAPAILIGGPDGHLLRTGAGSNNVVTPLRVAGGTLSVAGGQTFNVVGGFEQTGGLTEIAAGGSFSGGIVAAISGGTFRVDGSYTGTPTFTGTGVLSGAGTVAGTVTNTSGTVRPGSSPGTLTVTGNFNQGPNGTLEVDIEGTTAGNGFDVLAVTGQANLNGTLKAVHGGGFDPALNDVFAFMTSGSRAGAFAMLDAPTFLDGRAYLLDYPGSPGFGARLTLRPPSPPDNIKPPAITGTAVAGRPLTCNPGTWTANPALSIEWLRDNQPIAGATQSTYLLTGADAAHQVACRVTASNSSGDAQATSSAVNVSAAAPQNAAAPAITGTPAAGATLTCAGGTWTGVPTPAITYRWLRDGNPIAGAEQATYPVGAADVTSSLTCRVTATNSGGSASATAPAVVVAAVVPQNIAPPAISGSSSPGSTLACAPGSWAGIPGPSLRMQWLRDGRELAGATETTYRLTTADAGRSISCRVTATNAGGSVAATSAGFAAAKPRKPAEQVLAEKSKDKVATAIGLPSAKRCIRIRKFRLRLRQPNGVRIRSVRVVARGKRVKTRKIKGRHQGTVNLRGLSKGPLTVRVTVTTTSKRKIVAQRRYRTCIRKKKAKKRAKRSAARGPSVATKAGAPAQ